MTVEARRSPRVGCGALIRNDKGDILLVKRLRDPEAGCWGFPGGKVDYGETAEAATLREINEELGLKIQLHHLAHLVNYIDLDQGQHWLAPVFEATIIAGTPHIREPLALAAFDWFAVTALPSNLTVATRQTLLKE